MVPFFQFALRYYWQLRQAAADRARRPTSCPDQGRLGEEDFADPPMLGTIERAFKKVAHGTYVLTTYGKGT